MPNGRKHLSYDNDFGPHKYADHDGTSDCRYGCGCWIGPTRSGAPAGVNPLGKCPQNLEIDELPESFGKTMSKPEILEDYINGRIDSLEQDVALLGRYRSIIEMAKEESSEYLAAKLRDSEKGRLLLEAKLKSVYGKLRQIETTIA